MAAAILLLFALARFVVNLDWRINRGVPFNADFVVQLAGRYELWRISSRDVAITRSEVANDPDANQTEVVPAEVISVGVQGNFITVSQFVGPHLDRPPIEADYKYWIIQVREETVWGPFAKVVFDAECKELGIDGSVRGRKSVGFYREKAERPPQKRTGARLATKAFGSARSRCPFANPCTLARETTVALTPFFGCWQSAISAASPRPIRGLHRRRGLLVQPLATISRIASQSHCHDPPSMCAAHPHGQQR